MFKEIKLPFNLSLLELFTIATFVAIGYSIVYKYSFYSELNVDWYLYSLQPNYILFSSIKLIFFILLGLLIGGAFLKPITNLTKTLFLYILFYFASVLIFFLIPESGLSGYEKANITLLIIGFILSMLVRIAFLIINTGDMEGKSKYYFILCMALALFYLFCSAPSMIGKKDAKNLSSSENSKVVKLKTDKDDWILVELNGDKALIMNKKDHKVFKLIEYKDIDTIRVD